MRHQKSLALEKARFKLQLIYAEEAQEGTAFPVHSLFTPIRYIPGGLLRVPCAASTKPTPDKYGVRSAGGRLPALFFDWYQEMSCTAFAQRLHLDKGRSSKSLAMEPSVLIVGAGTFGTSTAYHLAQSYKDPSRVSVLDSSPSPPKLAASIDINRIIRTDYPSPLYCNLAFEAIHAWFWSLELGKFFHRVGWLMLDERGSDLSERILKVFKDRGSTQTEDVPLDELGERWDILRSTETSGFQSAYFNPEAGWCDAAKATATFMETAEKRGVKRVIGHVTELLLDTNSGRIGGVRTADGQHLTADKIVLATGAWTSSLLYPIEDLLDIPEQDRVERQIQASGKVSAYYKISEKEAEQLWKPKMPVVVYGFSQGEVIPPSSENKLLKYNSSRVFTNTITTKSGRKISMPPLDQSQDLVPEKVKRETEAALTSRVMPEFTRGKQADHWRICWDAQTVRIPKRVYPSCHSVLGVCTVPGYAGHLCLGYSQSLVLPSSKTGLREAVVATWSFALSVLSDTCSWLIVEISRLKTGCFASIRIHSSRVCISPWAAVSIATSTSTRA